MKAVLSSWFAGAVLDVERTVRAVEGTAEAGVALGLDEVGQDVVEPPAGRAVGVSPLVVVAVVAADVDHRVHRGAPTEGLHARPVGATPVEVLLRRRLVVPVPLGLEQHRERQRDVDVVVVVGRSCLEEQHPDVGVLGQPGGDDASGAARSDDDVVERFVGHGLPVDAAVTRTTTYGRHDADTTTVTVNPARPTTRSLDRLWQSPSERVDRLSCGRPTRRATASPAAQDRHLTHQASSASTSTS